MVTASVPIDHTRLLWSIAGSSWAVVLQQGRGQDSLKSYGDGWCLLVLMSFGGSQSVAGEWGSNGSICKNMVGDSLSSGRMESTVPEDLEIRISSDYKELAYREQTVPFVRLFLSVYSASVFSLCCPKDSQMVVLSVTSAHRWDRERGREAAEQCRGSHSTDPWFWSSAGKVTSCYFTDFLRQSSNFK